MNNLLLLSDDPLLTKIFKSHIKNFPFQLTEITDITSGLENIKAGLSDIVVAGVPLMTEHCPKKILKKLQDANGYLPIFFLLDQLNVADAIALVKMGAENCYSKPFAFEAILEDIRRTAGNVKARAPANSASIPQPASYVQPHSKAATELNKQISVVADTNFKVIIYGETGTGKESVARQLSEGKFRDGPFVAIDCGCLSKELAASELFGHEKGSFTSAVDNKTGAFEEANNGTIFLDEIGNLDYNVQILLLRAIEEGKIRRVGGNKEIDIDIRIIVASNERLENAVREGRFREDLFYRLNEFEINIPPLRERIEDLDLFIDFFIAGANKDLGKHIRDVSPALLKDFYTYSWPGNIRQLKNIIRRGCLMADDMITRECMPTDFLNTLVYDNHLPGPDGSPQAGGAETGHDFKTKGLQAEIEEILRVLREENYNKTRTAQRLNIDRKTLYNKLKNFRNIKEDS